MRTSDGSLAAGTTRTSGTASVCAFYALFAIVILTMWRTSGWIGLDGLVANYRQHHKGASIHLHIPRVRDTAGTVGAAHKVA